MFRFFLVVLFLFSSSVTNAAIISILGDRQDGASKSCPQQGYTRTVCKKGSLASDFCSSNKKYFRNCVCDRNVYKYNESNCKVSLGAQLSGGSCIDDVTKSIAYKKCVCPTKYKRCKQDPSGTKFCIDEEGAKYLYCVEDIPTCESIGYQSTVLSGQKCDKVSNKYMTCYRNCVSQ